MRDFTRVPSTVSMWLTLVLMSPSPLFAGDESGPGSEPVAAGAPLDVALDNDSRLGGESGELYDAQIVTKPQIKPAVKRFGQKKIWKVLGLTALAVGVAVLVIYAVGGGGQ
jgi:hypothetical protein